MSDLFRKEAIAHSTRRLEGEVVVALPLPLRLLGMAAAIIIIFAIAFSFNANYSRKEIAPGWLTPDQGVIRVISTQSGRLDSLNIVEGDQLTAGDPIASLRLDTDTNDGGTGQRLLIALQSQVEAAERAAEVEIERLDQEQQRLEAVQTGLETEQAEISRQITLQQERVTLANEQVSRAETLAENGFMSTKSLDDRRLVALTARQDLAALERAFSSISRQINDAHSALISLPLQIEAERARAASARAALEERLTTQSARTQAVITAPVDVRVAAIPVREGQTLAAGETIAVTVPANGQLVAELYLPSRAVGFIRKGQEVRLMYQAFPHQRFGTGKATITRISRTVLAPREAAIPGIQLAEPVFRVEATLESTEVEAYGESIPLQPGMLLNADIIIDRRSLIEWLFDPLFAAGRRG